MFCVKNIVLASRSPRRDALLRQVGARFTVKESCVDEAFDGSKTPEENVVMIAFDKAKAVADHTTDAIVIGADTTVVLAHHILAKPNSAAKAKEMLGILSGKEHTVFTGVALIDRPSNVSRTFCEATQVKFRILTSAEIDEYVSSGSPMDKAGAYGIQDDYGALFVEKVNGCFYNVVGLPLTRLYTELQKLQLQLGLK